MSRLLALDQSSRCTGYAVFEDKKLVTAGTFTITDQDTGIRLTKIKQQVKNLIETYEITEVVYEDIQLQNNVSNNVQTFKILAEVFGVLTQFFAESNLPHTAVLASSWKSTLNIKGRDRATQKRNAQEYVLNKYNQKFTQDACDAICIGCHHLHDNSEEEINWAF